MTHASNPNNGSSVKHARTIQAYMAVKHLPNAEAGRLLGRSTHAVNQYRTAHPQVAYVAGFEIAQPRPARPGIVQHVITRMAHGNAVSSDPVVVMTVSLPAPPWAGGFGGAV